jgi:hypothetical protein
MNFILTIASIAALTLTACASMDGEVSDPSEVNARSPLLTTAPYNLTVPKAHIAVIEDNSAGDSQFSGLYNTFELKATILNSEVREALLRRQSQYYQWDQAQQNTERERTLQELSSEANVFLSFSTPERKNDNLADKKSIWRIFLDVGGRRYVGQAKKERRLIAELQSLFPYHTRWNTPYMLTFPVGMTAIEAQTMKLTLTGPLGSRVLEFRSLGSTAEKPEVQPPRIEEPPTP